MFFFMGLDLVWELTHPHLGKLSQKNGFFGGGSPNRVCCGLFAVFCICVLDHLMTCIFHMYALQTPLLPPRLSYQMTVSFESENGSRPGKTNRYCNFWTSGCMIFAGLHPGKQKLTL